MMMNQAIKINNKMITSKTTLNQEIMKKSKLLM